MISTPKREPSPAAARISSPVSGAMMIPTCSDARRRHRLDPVEQDRLVGHRHELLGRRVGDRAQARAATAGEDQALELAHRGGSVAVSSRAAQLAVIPARGPCRTAKCRPTRLAACLRIAARTSSAERHAAVARRDLGADLRHRVELAHELALALEHHAAQLVVLLPGLDLRRCSAGRARGCAPSGTSRRSTTSTRRRARRTRAASGAASRRARSSRRSASAARRAARRSRRRRGRSAARRLTGRAGSATSRSAASRTASRRSAGSITAASPASLSTCLTR